MSCKFGFTADDLNNCFLSAANKFASSLPHASISLISFCSRGFIAELEVISITNGLDSKKASVLMVFQSDLLKPNLILLAGLLPDL